MAAADVPMAVADAAADAVEPRIQCVRTP